MWSSQGLSLSGLLKLFRGCTLTDEIQSEIEVISLETLKRLTVSFRQLVRTCNVEKGWRLTSLIFKKIWNLRVFQRTSPDTPLFLIDFRYSSQSMKRMTICVDLKIRSKRCQNKTLKLSALRYHPLSPPKAFRDPGEYSHPEHISRFVWHCGGRNHTFSPREPRHSIGKFSV